MNQRNIHINRQNGVPGGRNQFRDGNPSNFYDRQYQANQPNRSSNYQASHQQRENVIENAKTEPCRYARAAPGKRSLVEFKGHNSTSDQKPQTVLINYLPHSEGLFLDLKIEKESVTLLVDTGANHSIPSMHLFNKLNYQKIRFRH